VTTRTSPLRSALKRGVEQALGSPLVARIGRRRRRGSRLILAFHNVVPVAPAIGSDRSLHLSLAAFRAQLDSIDAAGLRVVALDAALDDRAPQVSITFDDAYAGALLHGIPELARRGWPSTVFVAPGLLGSPAPWWDRLAVADSDGIPPRVREGALWDCAGDEALILKAASTNGWHCSDAVEGVRIGTESEVANAIALDPALTVGAHSWSHANLAAVSTERLRHELDAPLTWLQ
jgi:peptidoglycan/xylan/chitin deacetylase (PgdA/CDA1 family)